MLGRMKVNPIRSGLFQTANDLENYYVNLHYSVHVHFTRCFSHVPIGIFQKFAILTILQRFQNKKVAKIVVKIIFLLFCLK